MPRKFDLNNYVDTQEERIVKFWQDNPDGAIVTKLMSPPDDFTTCRYEAAVYRHKDDIRASATGYAYEVADIDPRDGANFGSHEENCETSAIGRAMANLGMAKSRTDRPSRQEMGKVNRVNDQPPRNAPARPSAPQHGAEPPQPRESPQRTVDTSTGEILDEGPEDWTEFWKWARAQGYKTKADVEAAIGQPMSTTTPGAIYASLIQEQDGQDGIPTTEPKVDGAQTKAMKRLHVVGSKRNLSHDDLHLLGLAAGFSSLTEMSAQEIRNLGDWIEDRDTHDDDIADELRSGQARMDEAELAQPIDSQTADWIAAIDEKNNLTLLEALGKHMKDKGVDGVAVWTAFASRRQALLKSAG